MDFFTTNFIRIPLSHFISGLLRQETAQAARDYLGITGGGSGITQLTGDVTATGPGSVAATIGNNKVTYAKMQNISAASMLLGRGDSGSGVPQEITLGSNLSMSGTTLNASGGGGGSGTVTNTGTLAADQLVVGNGGVDVKSKAAPGDATKFLNGAATPDFAQVKDSDLALTDITTNNATTGRHGFVKKLDGNDSNYLDGTGNFSNPTGGMAIGWFRFDSSTTVADPGTGDFRLNAASWGATTVLVFDQISDPGNDVTAMIMLMRANDQILIQKKNDSTIFGRFTVTATPTNHTGWFSVPVTNVVDSGTIPTNTQLCAMVVSYDGGGGGSGITQLTGDVTAGPGSGSQAATIPNDTITYAKMQNVSAASKLLGRGSAGGSGDPEEITLGSNLSMSGTTLNASAGSGTDWWYEYTEYLITPAATSSTAGGILAVACSSESLNQSATNAFIAPTSSSPLALDLNTNSSTGDVRYVGNQEGANFAKLTSYDVECQFVTWAKPTFTTSARLMIGVVEGAQTRATQINTDAPTGRYAVWRYSTTAGDTNWKLVIGDNSSTEVIDSGVAVSTSTFVKLEIRWDGTAANSFKGYINGSLVASGTLNPAAATNFRMDCVIKQLASIDPKNVHIGTMKLRVKKF